VLRAADAYRPATHAVHTVRAVSLLKNPTGQSTHASRPLTLPNRPLSHAVHVDAWKPLNVPAGQKSHTVSAVAFANVPPRHTPHVR
jgi:hypothetical protein